MINRLLHVLKQVWLSSHRLLVAYLTGTWRTQIRSHLNPKMTLVSYSDSSTNKVYTALCLLRPLRQKSTVLLRRRRVTRLGGGPCIPFPPFQVKYLIPTRNASIEARKRGALRVFSLQSCAHPHSPSPLSLPHLYPPPTSPASPSCHSPPTSPSRIPSYFPCFPFLLLFP